ncbi:putative membrane protein [Leptospira santarosai str. CBC1531]|uniref:O-antigen ligase family protein n=1 Tax=Leptospira santarosai TaxID=28183 RepID=UPI0002BF2380|nr:O-antigen ligase family protein [Leptospira santarosai]EMP80739.1 putative membrane protein [Leptospira santarosai str. CBC1531]
MKNWIRSRFLTTSFGSFFWIVFGILLILPLLSFYPWKFRIVFVFLFVCFAVLDVLFPLVATFFLAASGIVFGNHPGGRFLELQDCLWIFWCVRGIVENYFRGSGIFTDAFWKHPIGILLLLFFGAGVLSLIANPDLFFDFRFYQKGWFWFLHSTELEPAYPIKLLLLGILFLFGLIARKNWLGDISGSSAVNPVYRIFASGVVVGMIVSITVGWLEYFSPEVKSILDFYHKWLDGYKFSAFPHSLIPFLKRFLPKFGIQSLFWNRSWFSIYLISGLPFLFYCVFAGSENFKIGIFKKSKVFEGGAVSYRSGWFLLSVVLLVFGATFFWIGARGGIFSFVTFCVLSVFIFPFFLVKNRNTSRMFAAILASHFVMMGILFPLSVIWMRVGPMDPERFSHFLAGLTLGIGKPLLGGGFESYGWYNECCLNPEGRSSTYHTTHNQFLQIFSGLGITGLAFYSLLWCFLFYELLKFRKNDRSVLVSSVFFSSVAAVFVYSFFQEWFYLRVVYFQWIALFPFFTERSAAKVRFRFHRKNIAILLCLILVLLFGSWFLFPTKTFRSGIYFPPKGRGYKAWILEGNGKMSLASRPELYLITPNREMDRRSTLSISVSGGYRKIHPRTIKGLKEEYLAFRTVKGKNILKTECTLRQKTDPFRTLNFWSRRPLDPEPRKICSQIRIRKKVDLLPKKVLRKRFKKRS